MVALGCVKLRGTKDVRTIISFCMRHRASAVVTPWRDYGETSKVQGSGKVLEVV